MAVSEVTDTTFKDKVINQNEKFVLVDFWAEWCGPCRMLAPVVESISNKFSDQLDVYKLDTDANAQTAQDYKITGIPCVILFKNGEEVTRLTGYRSEATFETELEQHLK